MINVSEAGILPNAAEEAENNDQQRMKYNEDEKIVKFMDVDNQL
jgi:hypothetical protein